MPVRRRVLIIEEQAQIRALKDAGLTDRAIARQLGRSYGCVDHFLRNPNRSAPVPGRPRLISSQNRRRISRMVSNSTWSVNQVRAETRLSASRTTIWRCIRSNEHICRQTMQKAPHLTNFHKQAYMARNGKM
ncbi:unnamed protein product [Heligmosomoides polygyrus]|uniref:HTH_Tnp_Tc3_1 domain-containing protein n=1 Tax=Heligmosomoides polygyrus TaxID=6339 RepID=A0A183FI08_HELPZ|nr:unnamed protein product [Heligmosomoides polygyrus]